MFCFYFFVSFFLFWRKLLWHVHFFFENILYFFQLFNLINLRDPNLPLFQSGYTNLHYLFNKIHLCMYNPYIWNKERSYKFKHMLKAHNILVWFHVGFKLISDAQRTSFEGNILNF